MEYLFYYIPQHQTKLKWVNGNKARKVQLKHIQLQRTGTVILNYSNHSAIINYELINRIRTCDMKLTNLRVRKDQMMKLDSEK